MEIIVIKDKQIWDAGLLKHALQPSFLQSWEWGEILRAEGKEVERLAIVDGNEALAQAQVAYHELLFGWEYAFCPKGPVEPKDLRSKIKAYETVVQYLKNRGCIFFRIEPASILDWPAGHESFVFKPTIAINPQATIVLDLRRTEDQLLASFHHKTRQRVRRVRAEPLRISSEKDFAIFWQLLCKTSHRHSFDLHAEQHYRSMLDSPAVEQLTVFYKDTAIATTIFFGFGGIYTSVFGASDYAYRNLFASHFLHWEAITRAKRLGYCYYDFFGIAPRKHDTRYPSEGRTGLENDANDCYDYDHKHPYAGITLFKIRFGGEAKEYPGTFDIVLEPVKYKLYSLLRGLRRLL